MQDHVRTRILKLTGAKAIGKVQLIQPLWNNYGTLSRVYLDGGAVPSVIVKHIQIPKDARHPRGFTGDLSRRRKIRSYAVETHWYQHQNKRLADHVPTPKCLDAFADGGELFLLLEDLRTRGFTEDLHQASWSEICCVLRWLAQFHAQFLGVDSDGLWPSGTYWHLQTRPEELANIDGSQLHTFASLIDARLRNAPYQTLVHGDAKLANFLFQADNTAVAAVDFQYVGGGCAMKDVAYFVGSCLHGAECERRETEILAVYFDGLKPHLEPGVDGAALEAEWRALYPLAWADFQRFMLGWSPSHRKLTDYSDATSQRTIKQISDELLDAARSACLAAGAFIQANRHRPMSVSSKGLSTPASDVVTDIDLQAQQIILEHLEPTLAPYDLGILAEEGHHDSSRLAKHAFWTVDPLDGTQYFIEGSAGYATSIALVSQSGEPILGVVYDPVGQALFEVVRGGDVHLNGRPFKPAAENHAASGSIQWFADRSLKDHPDFARYQTAFDIHFSGGAVMNGINVLKGARSIYVKAPKKATGGCAIWDLAAVSLMIEICSGTASVYDGSPLPLNRAETVFFNDVGLCFLSAGLNREQVMALIDG